MSTHSVTFANYLGEMLAPFLIAVRSTGFFEAHIFMPAMTILSIVIFISLLRDLKTNGTFDSALRKRLRYLYQFAYYTLCFIVTNSTAVAFKTLIIQELDYTEMHWYIPYVGPLHFYITSIAAAFIYVIRRNRDSIVHRILCIYVQIGVIGGYLIAIHRILNEPFDLLDVTTGVSGIFFFIWFGILNLDLAQRLFPKFEKLRINIGGARIAHAKYQ